MLTHAVALLAALLHPVLGQGPNNPGTETFLSRPGQYSVKLNIQINKNISALGSGYIFTAPYTGKDNGNMGVHIYENTGELVYCGADIQEVRAMDPHVCDFLGKNTLCFTDAFPQRYSLGHSSGPDRFFDRSYNQVSHDFGAIGNLTLPDAHELNTPAYLKGQSFINDVFQKTPMDLTAYDGPKKGWIIAGCFIQRNIKKNTVEFQWCSDADVPVYETYHYLDGNSAGNFSKPKNKGTHDYPWDYFHINSIDQDSNGDYYVSSRDTHGIYKIAGQNSPNTGSIIWKLGGKQPDFTATTKEGNFYAQHHVRVHAMDGDTTLLSLYDNHFPPGKHSNNLGSSGKYVLVDESKGTSTLEQVYYQPDAKYTPTGGQVQTLDNGNVFIGWGSDPSVSEHSPGNPGDVLWYATFDKAYASYRSYKEHWTGKPSNPPDVFAYQQACNSSHMAVYMSWNGATEHKAWHVYGARKNANTGGRMLKNRKAKAGTFKRTGYETVAVLPVNKKIHRYIYIEALDSQSNVLGVSDAIELFVPDNSLASSCNDMRCPEGTTYGSSNSQTNTC